MPKIRTTITPGEEIEVPQWEADYLESEGLVHHSRAKTDEGAVRSEIRQQVEARSPIAGGDANDPENADGNDGDNPDTTENQES